MKEFSDKDIEMFFVETTSGFYLNECAKNGGEDEKGFYNNQLSEFAAGFKCCLKQMNI